MPFFSLPKEIRCMIYRDVFEDCELYFDAEFQVDDETPHGYRHLDSMRSYGHRDFLMVSKQAYRDAIATYHVEATVLLPRLEFVLAVKLSRRPMFRKHVDRLVIFEYDPDALVVLANALELKYLELEGTYASSLVFRETHVGAYDCLRQIAGNALSRDKAYQNLSMFDGRSTLLPGVGIVFQLHVVYRVVFAAPDMEDSMQSQAFTFDIATSNSNV